MDRAKELLAKMIRILEYNRFQLPLWYSVSFVAGILYFFEIQNVSIGLLLLAILPLLVGRGNLLKHFVIGLLLSFLLGVFTTKLRLVNIKPQTLEYPISCVLKGEVGSVEYSHKGVSFIIENPILSELLMQNNYLKRVKVFYKTKEDLRLDIGDYIEASVHLHSPGGKIVFDGFDFGKKNFFSNIAAVGYISSKLKVVHKKSSGIKAFVSKVRRKIYSNFINNMGEESGSFAAALFLGKQSGLSHQTLDHIRRAGVSHVLCVSGLHMSLVFGFFFIFTRILLNCSNFIAWRFDIKFISAVIAIIFAFFYLVLTDFGIASVRAYIMCLIVMFGMILWRQTISLRSVSIGVFVILLKNPEYAYYPSFQLSFIAVIILISGFEFIFNNKKYLGNYGGILSVFLLNIYSSVLVSIATIPIVIYHFFIISNYMILSNLLIVPIVSFLIMPIGILSLILLPIFPVQFLDVLNSKIINIVIKIAKYISELKGAVYHFGQIDPGYLIVYIFGLLWIVIWRGKIRYLGSVIILMAFIGIVFDDRRPTAIMNTEVGFLAFKDMELNIIGENLSKFHLEYIASYYGMINYQYSNYNIFGQNLALSTKFGNSIKVEFSEGPIVKINGALFRLHNGAIYCAKSGCTLKWL